MLSHAGGIDVARSVPVTREVRVIYRYGAVAFVVLALIPAYFAVTLSWFPSADFDVTGMLFLMQNAPRLTAIVATVVCVATALAFFLRSLGLK